MFSDQLPPSFTSRPVLPSSTHSGTPHTPEAITGFDASCASSRLAGSMSRPLGRQYASMDLMNFL